ncbi:MAG: carbon monoxide dehydrogenase [Sulfobacillus benefaciens]|uniref:Carbon monoxide dehydrogenase n=1 Tax=Sulfobacillus benefaciens TaxID=453960 RepID=A0A2T2XI29_9FIRM|nr:MAG: carbon monoxide dehydrogenase [Sulfobacillus benefaciens]
MADIATRPGTKEAAILRSPHAHARILAIDVSEAVAVKGVVSVVTGQDVLAAGARPLVVAAPVPADYYPIAVEKVRYVGEPVAVVVARTRAIAEDAAAKIKVSYDPLPAVLGIEEALDPGSAVLHDALGHNVAVHRHLRYGDPDGAFKEAAHVVTGRYWYPKVSSTPIETYGVIATWEQGDTVTIWANFQGPFSMHPVMARALGIGQHQLRVIVPPDIGGAFGIKISIYPYMVLMALVAKIAGVPVRWLEDRLEALAASSSGTDRLTDLTAAVSNVGKVIAWRMRLVDNVGAYIRAPEPGSLFRATGNLVSGYQTQNLDVEAIAVMTNKCPTGPNRGYGVSALYFAMERHMDKIAALVGKDPAEIRRINLIPHSMMPYRTPSGGYYDSGDYLATLERALERADYDQLRQQQQEARRQGRLFGIGIAVGVDPSVSNMGYIDIVEPPEDRKPHRSKSGSGQGSHVQVDASGGVTITLSTCAQGQGHETVAAQLAADILGVDPKDIRVIGGMDSSTRNWTIATGAYSSRFAATGAVATFSAVQQIREKLLDIASHVFEADRDDVQWVSGRAEVKGVPARALTLKQLAGIAHWDVASLPPGMEPGLAVQTYFTPPTLGESVDPEDRVNSSGTYGFMADVVAVEVDSKTFAVKIHRYATVHDIGKVLNPAIVEGQIYGAALHGIGAALLEEMVYDDQGQLLTGTFMDYVVPSAPDAPDLIIDHMDYAEGSSLTTPLGAKGVGESSTETAPAALANAVSDALGIDINQLPMTPNRLFHWFLQRESLISQEV